MYIEHREAVAPVRVHVQMDGLVRGRPTGAALVPVTLHFSKMPFCSKRGRGFTLQVHIKRRVSLAAQL